MSAWKRETRWEGIWISLVGKRPIVSIDLSSRYFSTIFPSISTRIWALMDMFVSFLLRTRALSCVALLSRLCRRTGFLSVCSLGVGRRTGVAGTDMMCGRLDECDEIRSARESLRVREGLCAGIAASRSVTPVSGDTDIRGVVTENAD